MKKFEYKDFYLRESDILDKMNEFGEQGWEVCAVKKEKPQSNNYYGGKIYYSNIYMKREKND